MKASSILSIFPHSCGLSPREYSDIKGCKLCWHRNFDHIQTSNHYEAVRLQRSYVDNVNRTRTTVFQYEHQAFANLHPDHNLRVFSASQLDCLCQDLHGLLHTEMKINLSGIERSANSLAQRCLQLISASMLNFACRPSYAIRLPRLPRGL